MNSINNCMICGSELEYFTQPREMACMVCHDKFEVTSACRDGHYVCDKCHAADGLTAIEGFCRHTGSTSPLEIANTMMRLPSIHMHGPEHHVLVGSALLAAYHNCGGNIELESALAEMKRRGSQVPGGACGFWGCCGAAVSAGMFVSIVTGATPLKGREWRLSNMMTSAALNDIAANGGPRCCKRDSFLAIRAAIRFAAKHLNVYMDDAPDIRCGFSSLNGQCLGRECVFNPAHIRPKVAFVCVHNSCRSQIAEALGKHLAADAFESFSAGSALKSGINPDAVRIMSDIYGIDMEHSQRPKRFEDIPEPDFVVSMGCDVSCPYIGREFDANWQLLDPTGQGDEVFKEVIRQIECRILELKSTMEVRKNG